MEQINLRGVVEDWYQSRSKVTHIADTDESPRPVVNMYGLDFEVPIIEWTMKTDVPTIQNFKRNVNISNKTGRPALAIVRTHLSNSKSIKFSLKSATIKGLMRRVRLPLENLPPEVREQFVEMAEIDLDQPESEMSDVSQNQDLIEQKLSFVKNTALLPLEQKEFKAKFQFCLVITGNVAMLQGKKKPQSFHKIVKEMKTKEDYLENLIVGAGKVLILVEGSARFRWVTVNRIDWECIPESQTTTSTEIDLLGDNPQQ